MGKWESVGILDQVTGFDEEVLVDENKVMVEDGASFSGGTQENRAANSSSDASTAGQASGNIGATTGTVATGDRAGPSSGHGVQESCVRGFRQVVVVLLTGLLTSR